MGLFFKPKEERALSYNEVFGSAGDITKFETNAMRENTFFSAVDFISSSVAKLPLEVLNIREDGSKIADLRHPLAYTLSTRFNNCMSSYLAIKTFVANGIINGISALYIQPDKTLIPVNINGVIVDDKGLINSTMDNPILYQCSCDNYSFEALERNLILFRYGYSPKGTSVNSIKSLLSEGIDTLLQGQKFLNKVYQKNGMGKIGIQLTSTVHDKKELGKIQNKFDELFSNGEDVFAIPAGYNAQVFNPTMKDNEYSAIRQLSKKEIISAFHLPPTLFCETGEISYSTAEALALDIYTNCLHPILKQIELEFTHKYLPKSDRGLKCIEFNEDDLIRLDTTTKINNLTRLLEKSCLTTNDIRKELCYEPLDNPYADEVLLQSGYMPLSTSVEYYTKDVNKNQNDGKGGDGDNGN